MKLTEIERTIIVMNIIGTVLKMYKKHETTQALNVLKEKYIKFSRKQSGSEERIIQKARGGCAVGTRIVIVDAKRHERFVQASAISDRIWKESIDHFEKQNLVINAVTLIESIYLFHEKIITKHTTIKRSDIDAYRFYEAALDDKISVGGTAVGGYLMGLLALECGEKINGGLRAIRLKKEDAMERVA